jgi:hypothetical protein
MGVRRAKERIVITEKRLMLSCQILNDLRMREREREKEKGGG